MTTTSTHPSTAGGTAPPTTGPPPGRARRHRRRRARRVLPLLIVAALVATVAAACQPAWFGARIELRVLVFDDGNVNVELLRAEMDQQGVPYDVIDLTDPSRSPVTPALLSDDAAEAGKGHAYYQGIIFPDHEPAALSASELATVEAFQKRYGIRRVAAFAWPGPESGAHWPATGPAYSGTLDGVQGQVALPAAQAPWLDGPVPFSDGSWGALAMPRQVDGKDVYSPIVTVPIPGTGQQAPVFGHSSYQGIEEYQLTVTGNTFQEHARLIAPLVIDSITRGVHLGHWRNYFSVHVDDVFLPDDRWSTTGNCTPGEDCLGSPPITTTPIRMTPADVSAVIAWQNANGFTFDMAYNGNGSVEAQETGPDPLTTSLKANVGAFRWINHTFRHEYLGCQKDLTVRPWRCATGPGGSQLWFSQPELQAEIADNVAWAASNGIPITADEVVTGEHSGLATLPQQPTDNPFFAPALQATGITWIASDASREPQQRQVGPALTVPRYPMNIFYNVATRAEEVDEYNWIYTSVANGGSGICETDPNSTCIAPLAVSGFESYIIPTERAIAMRHVLGNDPRPTYAHQSNLAEERILLPVVESILNRYRSLYADSAPIVSPTQTQAGTLIRDMTNWTAATAGPDPRVTAYRKQNTVVIQVHSGGPVAVPLTTLPTKATAWGELWGGRRSGWSTVSAGTPLVVDITP